MNGLHSTQHIIKTIVAFYFIGNAFMPIEKSNIIGGNVLLPASKKIDKHERDRINQTQIRIVHAYTNSLTHSLHIGKSRLCDQSPECRVPMKWFHKSLSRLVSLSISLSPVLYAHILSPNLFRYSLNCKHSQKGLWQTVSLK